MTKVLTPHITPAVLGFDKDSWRNWNGNDWVLTSDWIADIEAESFHVVVKAFKGFTTDFGSIPRFYRPRVNQIGPGLVGFLPHDCLYATEAVPRKLADLVMLEMLQWVGMGWSRRNACYLAVRAGGGFVWDGHTKESIAQAKQFVEVELLRDSTS